MTAKGHVRRQREARPSTRRSEGVHLAAAVAIAATAATNGRCARPRASAAASRTRRCSAVRVGPERGGALQIQHMRPSPRGAAADGRRAIMYVG